MPLWTDDGVAICTGSLVAMCPEVVGDGSGGAIITWMDGRSGDLDIYTQRLNAAGLGQWTKNGVAICTAADPQVFPGLVADGSGGAIIAWTDNRSSNLDVYAQRVNADGASQWSSNGVAICQAAGDQGILLDLVSDDSGGAIISWMDHRSGGYDIYVQRVAASGAAQWASNGVAVCDAGGDQGIPILMADGSGGAMVAWTDERQGVEDGDVYAQRLDSSGVSQWADDGAAVCDSDGYQSLSTGVSDGSGGAIMAWTDTHASNDYNICAQRMSPSGARQWAVEGSAICAAIGNQVMPFAVEDGSGGAVIAWSDNRTGELDIYAQRVTCSGTPLWTEDGLAVCTARGNETCNTLMPALGAPLASDDQGGAIIAWTDYRSGSHCDIYAQRVSAGGGLGAPPNPPVNEAPGNGVLDLSVTPTLESSAFDDPDSKDSHAASQWRISGTAGDYSSAIFDSGADSVNLTQIAMPSNKLNGNTTYYWQVRHQDSQRLWSAWSAETSFTTRNRAPNAPITASPASSALEVSVTATLRSSPFSDPDTGDPHAASQWRITATAGDYSNPVFDSNTDNVCLTQMAIPPGKLTGNATYYWQVRHQDSHGVWSEWSAQTSFSTKNQVPNRPSGTSPTPGTTGVSLTPTLAAPLFSDPDTGDTHAASQWRIMATAGDYSSPVFESGTDTANLGELTVPSGALKNSTTYYWQVRHQDNHGDWSDWSEESAFTTQRGSRTWIWIVIGVAAAAAILGVGIGTWRLRSRNKAGPSPS